MIHMKILAATLIAVLMSLPVFAQTASTPSVPPMLITPPQGLGLPYTRSSRPMALAKITDCIALFPGSRYAYVYGKKVRFDDQTWRCEAVTQNGTVYVPASFAAVLSLTSVHTDKAPAYLADRWVYTIAPPKASHSGSSRFAGASAITIDNQPYVDVVAAAKAAGLSAYQHSSGLVLLSRVPKTLKGTATPLLESIITLFDTPEKFADPDIATKYVPTLARQGKWTDHVKVTQQQLQNVNGPETKWATAPRSRYDFTGFNANLLGSKVPPPGIYPRVLFSPEDVPVIAARVRSTKAGQMALIEMKFLFQKNWWNPNTSDGRIFQKLATGDTAGLNFDVPPGTSPTDYPAVFKDEQPGIYNSHVSYVPECLTSMAFYCLLTRDNVHGRQAAAAIANYYKLREPLLDEANALSDTEYGGTYTRPEGTAILMNANGAVTSWRSVLPIIAHMNLGLSLDFGGKWMTASEKAIMVRIIAKATYGKRAYGQDAPVRFRDVNWVAWDLPNFLAVTAIEGLPGFDREAYESNGDTVRAFCDWGIDDSGVIYESNGKSPGGLQFQTLSMAILARRGENLFGHPHWRKLLQAQVQMTSPSGRVTVNSGTQYVPFSRQRLSLPFIDERKAFYPSDLAADYLLTQAITLEAGTNDTREWTLANFTPDAYEKNVAALPNLRLPSPTYPGIGSVHGVLYDADFAPTTRAQLNLPLDFTAPTHGVFSSYSDRTPEAAWINMMVRPDHYLGAGHHHADAGMFHFSSGGVDWFTQSPFSQVFAGKYFNLVQIDGRSEPEELPNFVLGYQGAATYLGDKTSPDGAFASADLTYSYTYRWLTQPPRIWPESAKTMGWEMDPSPNIQRIYAGTARYKMRPWWPNYTYSNYIATSRAPYNPMKFVFRTVGLVRGRHPLGIVIDDARKDDQNHLYQWVAMLSGGVWQAQIGDFPGWQAVLAFRQSEMNTVPKTDVAPPVITPENGAPLLLVCSLGSSDEPEAIQVTTESGPLDSKTGAAQFYNRLAIKHSGTDAHFRVLLIPFHAGEPQPNVAYDGAVATVTWPDEEDKLTFTSIPDSQTQVDVSRGGVAIIQSH